MPGCPRARRPPAPSGERAGERAGGPRVHVGRRAAGGALAARGASRDRRDPWRARWTGSRRSSRPGRAGREPRDAETEMGTRKTGRGRLLAPVAVGLVLLLVLIVLWPKGGGGSHPQQQPQPARTEKTATTAVPARPAAVADPDALGRRSRATRRGLTRSPGPRRGGRRASGPSPPPPRAARGAPARGARADPGPAARRSRPPSPRRRLPLRLPPTRPRASPRPRPTRSSPSNDDPPSADPITLKEQCNERTSEHRVEPSHAAYTTSSWPP